ncbi:hypothetical protein QUF80_18620 [Desulfococcaceae bacterium HSG8]|nr:hypothetical protein [Desulfococcaceae bacterium HSG8]
MDENFLEFWGNFLISTARKKKQADDMTAWMQKASTGFDELMPMFRKFYGLEQLSEQSEDYKNMTEKAMLDFQGTFKEYMGALDFVPKREHLALVSKYETLKEKCADQEETIKHLRMLLNAKGAEQVQDIMREQGELFQGMVEGFREYFKDMGDSELSIEKSDDTRQEDNNLKGETKNDGTGTSN